MNQRVSNAGAVSEKSANGQSCGAESVIFRTCSEERRRTDVDGGCYDTHNAKRYATKTVAKQHTRVEWVKLPGVQDADTMPYGGSETSSEDRTVVSEVK